MRRLKKYSDIPEINTKLKTKFYGMYEHPSSINFPKGYKVENGFLIKNGTIISLSSPNLNEIAVRGFLHVDEAESYNTN